MSGTCWHCKGDKQKRCTILLTPLTPIEACPHCQPIVAPPEPKLVTPSPMASFPMPTKKMFDSFERREAEDILEVLVEDPVFHTEIERYLMGESTGGTLIVMLDLVVVQIEQRLRDGRKEEAKRDFVGGR